MSFKSPFSSSAKSWPFTTRSPALMYTLWTLPTFPKERTAICCASTVPDVTVVMVDSTEDLTTSTPLRTTFLLHEESRQAPKAAKKKNIKNFIDFIFLFLCLFLFLHSHFPSEPLKQKGKLNFGFRQLIFGIQEI